MKIIVEDNFLPDYEASRYIALTTPKKNAEDKTDYIFNDLVSSVKRNTVEQQKVFTNLIGEPVNLVFNEYRKYNVCLSDPEGYHIHHDDCDYIGIVYLNDNYSSEDGTQLLRHKDTGITRVNRELFGSQNVSEAKEINRDISKWEPYLKVQAKPNRLLIFEPTLYHSETRTFGNSFRDARVVEIFHMIKPEKLTYWANIHGISPEEIKIYDNNRPNYFI